MKEVFIPVEWEYIETQIIPTYRNGKDNIGVAARVPASPLEKQIMKIPVVSYSRRR